ncbi:protein-ADP-ribose hydrolase [Pseudoflavonifractor sp. 524-17]|uniref:protein-ADP-ribose hydrolase n=1 Tax=Pseudoflavonifractor sp. 524-17 TaxID=2304577 RepID=UPI0013798D76|nr:protein-ADP-ribose hydrolase [Pseudoflavonifractor sp. 524-17]NCE63949.1 protein-ADP-ribose hydrolase [Pseudoflavonifractor sp. 524-17]
MYQTTGLEELLRALLAEAGRGEEPLPEDFPARRKLLRALMNQRPPVPAAPELLALQDRFLEAEGRQRQSQVVQWTDLPVSAVDSRLALWRGDITLLACDAIVNAANSALLGCFHPGHTCIDNVIHSAAGIQLRLACNALMEAQGHPEPPGQAKITPGFHLPAKYVLHTVGPIVQGAVAPAQREALASCYRSCLTLAEAHGLESVAFCCVSTGLYGFPPEQAAPIAVSAVRDALDRCHHIRRVIFDVFRPEDEALYRALLLHG